MAPYFSGSTSAGLPGSSTPSQVMAILVISALLSARSIGTGSPPDISIAHKYCGKARWLYSGFWECGWGIAIRGRTGYLADSLPQRAEEIFTTGPKRQLSHLKGTSERADDFGLL